MKPMQGLSSQINSNTMAALSDLANKYSAHLHYSISKPLAFPLVSIQEVSHIAVRINQKEKKSHKRALKKNAGKIASANKTIRKYRNYTIEFKRQVVNQMREQQKKTCKRFSSIITRTSKQLGISSKNLYRWNSVEGIKQHRHPIRKARYPDMENKLVQLIKEHPTELQRSQIRKLAQSVFYKLYGSEEASKFHFSHGWYEKFKMRNKELFEANKMKGKPEEMFSEKEECCQDVDEGDGYTFLEEDDSDSV